MIIGLVSTNSFTKWITNTYLPQTAINFTSDIPFSSSSAPAFHMIDQLYYRFMCFIIFITQFWWTPIRIKNSPVMCSVQPLHLSRWKESYIKAEQQNLKPSLSELWWAGAPPGPWLPLCWRGLSAQLSCLAASLSPSTIILDKHLDSLNSAFHHLI